MYEWHKAIKLNYINTRINTAVVLRVPSTLHGTDVHVYHLPFRLHSRLRTSNQLFITQSQCWQQWTFQGRACAVYGECVSWAGTVCGTARRPHFSLAIISVTVQLWIYVFWVISVYFNIRNALPKFGTFLLRHLYIHTHTQTINILPTCVCYLTVTTQYLSYN
jgi:hypothetical protein